MIWAAFYIWRSHYSSIKKCETSSPPLPRPQCFLLTGSGLPSLVPIGKLRTTNCGPAWGVGHSLTICCPDDHNTPAIRTTRQNVVTFSSCPEEAEQNGWLVGKNWQVLLVLTTKQMLALASFSPRRRFTSETQQRSVRKSKLQRLPSAWLWPKSSSLNAFKKENDYSLRVFFFFFVQYYLLCLVIV